MFNPLKYLRNTRVGLVLGSGGALGMAHISVIEYLKTIGIPIQFISGSSIGAVIGALYGAGRLQEFKEKILSMSRRDMLSLYDPVIPRSGLIQGKLYMKFLEDFIPRDMQIEDLSVKLAINATDFYTGRTVVFTSGCLMEALRASISIPGVFVPVRYRNTVLIDGGVANPLPINIAREMGAGLTIAVNLHPRVHKNMRWKNTVKVGIDRRVTIDARELELIEENDELKKEDTEHETGRKWLRLLDNWLKRENREERDDIPEVPSIFETIYQSFSIMEYHNTVLLLKYYRPTVLIEPALMDVGTLDFLESPKILTEGYLACTRNRGALLRKVKFWV